MPESPRWLLAHGRTDEAEIVLERAEVMNRRRKPTEPNFDRGLSIIELQVVIAHSCSVVLINQLLSLIKDFFFIRSGSRKEAGKSDRRGRREGAPSESVQLVQNAEHAEEDAQRLLQLVCQRSHLLRALSQHRRLGWKRIRDDRHQRYVSRRSVQQYQNS